MTFGKWKQLRLAKNTALCTMSDELRLLTALRDETVHNGTIDYFSRIYEHAVDSKIKGRFLLIPDHNDGRILTSAGRRRFFFQDNHLNAILPTAIHKILSDALLSLRSIDNKIPTIWKNPESYYNRFKLYSDMMETAEQMGAFVRYIPSDI